MIANAKEEILDLLDKHGFVLQRDTKHLVYRQTSSGKVFTMSKTPSDFRAYPNALRDLKRLLGLDKRVATVGERREKKVRRNDCPVTTDFSGIEARIGKPTFQDQLAKVKETLTFKSITVADTTGLGKTFTGRQESKPEMQDTPQSWKPRVVAVHVCDVIFEQIKRASVDHKIIVLIDEKTGQTHTIKTSTLEL